MFRRVGRIVVLLVGVTVTLVLLPVAINVATGGALPDFLAPYAGWVWPVVGLLWLSAVTLTVLEFRRGEGAGITTRFPDHPKNRPNALDRVDRLVSQRLRNSLGEKVRIALSLDQLPDQVIRQSTLRVQPVDSDPREHLGSAYEAFELLDASMLVLGAPGAGKTTMLLELTRSLVALARDDVQQPIPMLVELSGWSRRLKEKQEFLEWLLAELNRQYGIPMKVADAWLSDGKLALLFDGLDEVAESDRDGCVRELNKLQDRFLIPQLVVSSRERDYEQLTSRLRLHGAVTIRPLSPHQVFDYLYFHDIEVIDPDLLGMLSTPLMLNILLLAVRDRRPRVGSSRKRLFDAYVVEVLSRRRTPTALYRPEQAIRWLWFLARNSEGAIVPGRFYRPYTRSTFTKYELPHDAATGITRLFLPSAYGALVACGMLTITLRFGWWTGLLFLVLGILLLVPLAVTFTAPSVHEPHPVPVRPLWSALGTAFGAALGVGSILASAAIIDLILRLPEVWIGLVFIAVSALVVAAWREFAWGSGDWTVSALKWGLSTAAGVGMLVLLFGLSNQLLIGWGVGLGLSPCLGVLLYMHSHCVTLMRKHTNRDATPEKSHLRLTGRAATAGGVAGLLAGLLLGDEAGGPAWLAFLGFALGLMYGPTATWTVGLRVRSITDVVVRIALTVMGHVPMRTKVFLRYASDRSILVAADGEYRFVHALVRDHLAKCDPDAIADQVRDRLANT